MTEQVKEVLRGQEKDVDFLAKDRFNIKHRDKDDKQKVIDKRKQVQAEFYTPRHTFDGYSNR